MDIKKCTKCLKDKPYSEFHKNARNGNGLNSRCKVCVNAYNNTPERKKKKSEWGQRPEYKEKRKVEYASYYELNRDKILQDAKDYLNNPENADKINQYRHSQEFVTLSRSYKLKVYNITIEQEEYLFKIHQGKCAICFTTKPGGRYNKFYIDHCHKTGIVRGLLCLKCNLGLGSLQDDPDLLKRGIDYLFNSDPLNMKQTSK